MKKKRSKHGRGLEMNRMLGLEKEPTNTNHLNRVDEMAKQKTNLAGKR
jgi:hypothetical protein